MTDQTFPPGLLISAPNSGAGKTTIALGLMRALTETGLIVQPFKSGPDYIDPAFHRAATQRASFNLDTWAMSEAMFAAIAKHGADADLCIAEGSMGLFDGVEARGRSGHGLSAETAKTMGWPVVLVVDVSGQAQSAAASALGFTLFDPDLPFAGVILNRCASPYHEKLARDGMEAAGLNVLGALPRRPDTKLPERHLGLVQATELPELHSTIAEIAQLVRDHVDLDAVRLSARGCAPSESGAPVPPPAQRIALAQDAAFSFTYPHLLSGWRAAGAEVMPFSPLANEAPDASADIVWLPGGYPELHAGALTACSTFLNGLKAHAAEKPVHGECGGYMVMGEAIIDADGTRHRMAGLLGLVTSFEERRLHLGYRRAVLKSPVAGFDTGTLLIGHEYHYSTILEQPDAPLAEITDAKGNLMPNSGSVRGRTSGSFFHLISG
ncbi:MAG: cobyrinate a,c-diamide synthase [Pseudomonadota bacterium]